MRALFNRDIATGNVDLKEAGWNYTSEGPDSAWRVLSDVLPAPEPVCYLLEPPSCTFEALEAIRKGTAIVKDWVVVGIQEEQESQVGIGDLESQLQTPLAGKKADL